MILFQVNSNKYLSSEYSSSFFLINLLLTRCLGVQVLGIMVIGWKGNYKNRLRGLLLAVYVKYFKGL
jgi:hypothetical protein